MTSATTLFLGFALGIRHATDPDHVVAMGTIVTRQPHLRRAVGTGVFWGVGHTATILVVGLLIIVMGVRVPEALVTALDLVVAFMLVTLGIVAARTRALEPERPSLGEKILLSRWRPLFVGIVHGLAGSAAMTLLALTTIPDEREALCYLALFGVGTVIGMVLITMALALALRWLRSRGAGTPTIWIARASGISSIAAGALIAGRALISP